MDVRMRLEVLDLDGAMASQVGIATRWSPTVIPLRDWGPRIRIACRFTTYCQFAHSLNARLGPKTDSCIRMYGSGDFHHVTLALLSRLTKPFNLLVFDNHPDWMRRIPFMHCGTWLNHAARLPRVRRVFHVGGDVDFDNGYRRLAPWDLIKNEKVVVLPARRKFTRGHWRRIPHHTCSELKFNECFQKFRADLEAEPLYVSIDKDVLRESDAFTNWDSGRLSLDDLLALIGQFVAAARGNVAGIDLLGDWSPVRTDSWLGRLCHWTQHRAQTIDPELAAARNEAANTAIIETLLRSCHS
jgi:hypothetical protein